jgi:hypothetical protein
MDERSDDPSSGLVSRVGWLFLFRSALIEWAGSDIHPLNDAGG